MPTEVTYAPEAVAPEVQASRSVPEVRPASGADVISAGEAPTFLARGRIRRRARYLRRLREVQLRDIGGFVVELHRFGRRRPDLVEAKLAGAVATDRELRALERALGEPVPVRELRAAGIGGACARCGAVYGSGDRFCAWCGTSVGHGADPDTPNGEDAEV